MSWSLWTFIEYKDEETDSWNQLLLYTKEKEEYKPVEIEIGNADYTFMNYIFEDSDYAHRKMPKNLSPELKEFFFNVDEDNRTFFNWGGDATWFDFIELGLLAKDKTLLVDDVNRDEEAVWNERQERYDYPQINPLTWWYKQVAAYVNFTDKFWSVVPGQIRVFVARAR